MSSREWSSLNFVTRVLSAENNKIKSQQGPAIHSLPDTNWAPGAAAGPPSKLLRVNMHLIALYFTF